MLNRESCWLKLCYPGTLSSRVGTGTKYFSCFWHPISFLTHRMIEIRWIYITVFIRTVSSWCLLSALINWFNPVPTRLCHVIYFHSNKKYPCLVVMGLNCLFDVWSSMHLTLNFGPDQQGTHWLRLKLYTQKCESTNNNRFHIKWINPWQLKKSKSWEPFWSYQLISTADLANLAIFWGKWAGLAVLFSW